MSTPGSPSKDINIKGKLNDIYNSLDKNNNRANNFESRIKQLESDRDSAGDDMAENIKALNTKIDSEVRRVLDEIEHRFSLQQAENKRIAAQLTQSKSDYSALQDKVNALEDRIHDLEKEIGQ